MANKYELRKFEPVNNETYQFQEVSVNGKYLFQEFVENLKDQRDIKNVNKYILLYGHVIGFYVAKIKIPPYRRIKT